MSAEMLDVKFCGLTFKLLLRTVSVTVPCMLVKLLLCLARAVRVQLSSLLPQRAWGVLTLHRLSAAERFQLDLLQLTSYDVSGTTLQGVQRSLAWQ